MAIIPRKKHDYPNGGTINSQGKEYTLDRQHDPQNTERSIGEVHAEILKAVGTATADRKRKPVFQQGM